MSMLHMVPELGLNPGSVKNINRILSSLCLTKFTLCSDPAPNLPAEEAAIGPPGGRKSARLSRQFQLSPVKESLVPPQFPATDDSSLEQGNAVGLDTSDLSEQSEACSVLADLDIKLSTEKCLATVDWKIIARIEKERILLFVHFREQKEGVFHSWKSSLKELKCRIQEICMKVNQGQLLRDLHDTRLCNRLLEPESQVFIVLLL